MAINNVTELDFDQIKANFKTYLRSQEEFNDFDFDGAGISVLLDLLAYNTQYNAVLSHIAMNETFLDSAELRSNVVSHAKLIGYTPRSTRSSMVNVDVTVTGNDNTPAELNLTRGTVFTSSILGVTYNFVATSNYNTTKDSNNRYSFINVELKEGSIKTFRYRFDGTIDYEKFIIDDTNVDTDTIVVRVYPNEQSVTYSTYTFYQDITTVTSESEIYFIQENSDSRYELYFGDGSLGVKPESGAIVEVEYISSNGSRANGGKTFTAGGSIGGLTNISTALSSTFTRSFNGADKEDIGSVRFNAPLYYSSQNRAVTSKDYRALILNQYGDVEDVAVWGGEQNDPPTYGKVFLSIKVFGQDYISTARKAEISQYLENKNVGSVTTEIIDPEFTKIIVQAFYKYNSEKTSLSEADLTSKVRTAISDYNTNVLNKFDGVFRYSNVTHAIDNSDPSISNSTVRLAMYKTIVPNTLTEASYRVKFSSNIYISTTNEETLTSSTFTYNGLQCKFGDEPIANSTTRRIFIYIADAGTKVFGATDVGRIYPADGLVEINNIRFDSNQPIELIVSPDSNDIAPKYNQLVQIDMSRLTIDGEVDDILVYGSSGTASYQTTPRHES